MLLSAAGRNGSRPRRGHWLALGLVAALAVLADQGTKYLIADALPAGTMIDGVGPIRFSHTDNSGLALGVLDSSRWLVITATLTLVLTALVIFGRSRRATKRGLLSLGLVIGGSSANLIDRVFVGHVTDIVGIHLSPVFNLADLFILVGLGIFARLELGGRSSSILFRN